MLRVSAAKVFFNHTRHWAVVSHNYNSSAPFRTTKYMFMYLVIQSESAVQGSKHLQYSATANCMHAILKLSSAALVRAIRLTKRRYCHFQAKQPCNFLATSFSSNKASHVHRVTACFHTLPILFCTTLHRIQPLNKTVSRPYTV